MRVNTSAGLWFQVVTDVVCVITYFFTFNVLLTSSLATARLLLPTLPCNLISLSVLAWKLSFLALLGCMNWLREDSSSISHFIFLEKHLIL